MRFDSCIGPIFQKWRWHQLFQRTRRQAASLHTLLARTSVGRASRPPWRRFIAPYYIISWLDTPLEIAVDAISYLCICLLSLIVVVSYNYNMYAGVIAR